MRKILVTGANGFVGFHLVNELLLAEENLVYALVRNPKSINITHPRLTILKGDLFNLDALTPLDHIDEVIHTAGIVHSYYSHDFFSTNTDGTKNLLDVVKDKNIKKFILISSLAAAGPSLNGPIHEDAKSQPVSIYGQSKLMAENILNEFEGNFLKIIIRPPMVIGPNDPAVLDIFKMVKDRFILLPGLDSKSKDYSFVCVFDLVKAIIKALDYQNKENLEVFYIAYPEPIKFVTLVESINRLLGNKKLFYLSVPSPLIFILSLVLKLIHRVYKHQLRLTPDKTNELFPRSWTCDSQKSIKQLKIDYQFPLEKTLDLTLKNYQSKNWI